ncbi:MAG: flagellar M-ring protein FliF [Alicyclobacillus sp.]|nr:flagellar M-ring protein FliF [Alicyclobacillus sp.]
MNESVRKWWAKLGAWWSHFQPGQRRNLLIAGAALLVCLVVVLWVVLRPNYVTIMTGLDDKSLGQVENELETLKIPSKINGTAVLVPAADADKARVQLSMAGLPQTGYIGYSSVSSSFGMTQDQFNIQVLDALQQSLNQTIESIDGIESAQVHIVMPTNQLFVSQQTDSAKASVFVQLGNGVNLTSGQVQGIQQLVSHSVQGLTPDNVTVVDQNGVTLSSSDASATGLVSTDELATRQRLEQSLTQELTAGLNQILGLGNAVVMVHANVQFNQTTSYAHIYQAAPGQSTGLLASSQTTRSSSSQAGTGAVGGIAGQASTNPNLPSYAGTGNQIGGSNSTSTTTVDNYVNSYVDTHTVQDPIQISGYTVGIILNSANHTWSPATLAQIKAFVANAVGASQGGNGANSITVQSMPFTQTPVQSALQQRHLQSFIWGGLGALGALLVAVGWVRRRRRAATPELVADEPVVLENLEEVPMSEDERMKEELSRLANRKPDEFANLLRTWLAE